MITSEQEEVLGVLDLVREQQADGLERLLAAVDVVAEEAVVDVLDVARVRIRRAVGREEALQVAKLLAEEVDGGVGADPRS